MSKLHDPIAVDCPPNRGNSNGTAPPSLARYLHDDFDPCALTCTSCEGLAETEGPGKWMDYGHVKLFLSAEE